MAHGRERGQWPRRTPRWGRAAALSGVATTLLVLGVGASRELSLGFLAAVAAALATQVAILAVLDRREGSGPLTPATVVTVLRGSAAVALAGFLLAGRPALSWLPACLFGAAVALDAVDGALARATNSTSAFGAALDIETDALAVIVGVLVAVRAGQAPVVFLAVGLARYVFLAAAAIRRYRGSPVGGLPPRTSRRVLGAVQMVALALVLAPIPGETVSHLLAVAVMGPVLAGFVRDWLLVR